MKTIQDAYERAVSLHDMAVERTAEKPPQVVPDTTDDIHVTITTNDNVDFTLRTTSLVHASCGLFNSVCVRDKDKIKLHYIESSTFHLVIRFCTLLEQDDAMSDPRLFLGQAANHSFNFSSDTYDAIAAFQSELTSQTIAALLFSRI